MGTQKNRLNETVLLSTQNIYKKIDGLENIHNFMLKSFVYLDMYWDCLKWHIFVAGINFESIGINKPFYMYVCKWYWPSLVYKNFGHWKWFISNIYLVNKETFLSLGKQTSEFWIATVEFN